MRVDRADRSFFAIVGLALLPYALLGVFGCGLLTVVSGRVARDGLSALSTGSGDLRPIVVVFLVVVTGTLFALLSFIRQLRATRRLAARVASLALPRPPQLVDAATRAKLAGRLDFVDAPDAFSFAYGLPRSRVAVSRGLVEVLNDDELHAVLEHERHHVRHLDPLKVVFARVLASAYFFLPALRGLRARYGAASELAADRRAIERVGRGALAGALYRVVRGPAWEELATAAAIGGPDLLAVRVAQLENGRVPDVAPVPRTATVATLVVLGLMVASVVASVMAAGGLHEVMYASEHSQPSETGLGWHDLWVAAPLGLLALRLRWRLHRSLGPPA